MERQAPDDLLDLLVARYADRVQAGAGAGARRDDLLGEAPPEHRAALERCFAMIDAGLAAVPSAAHPLGPGATLGGYRIEGVLGRGGMATVYRALEPELRRDVALKVLRPGLALDARHVDRFAREARAAARLQHPHIVAVHAVGAEAGYHFLAMERVDGPSLAEVLAALPDRRPWTARDLARAAGVPALADHGSYERALAALLAPVARAIGVAHGLGIVHRDVKPSNILVHRDGRAMVTDFGLARSEADLALSLTGEPLGTPYYMAPEQLAAAREKPTARTDVYGLGVTLYEALTGARPFGGESLTEVFDAIRRGTPPSVRAAAPECTREVADVVRKAMAREPRDRYASAQQLADDLDALAHGRPTRAGAEVGGPVARAWRAARVALASEEFEYRSARSWLGWPLVHVHRGGPGRRRVGRARGWLAVGDVAVGAVAVGNVAVGGLSLGVLSVGAVALAGALAVGGLLGIGGGLGAGLVGLGGAGAGYAAFGGYAAGLYAMGGKTHGAHVINGRERDPEAVAFFDEHLPWLFALLGPRGVLSPGAGDHGAPAAPGPADVGPPGARSGRGEADDVDAGQGEPGWHRAVLGNGVRVTVVHAPQAPVQSLLTFLPLGLGTDAAGRAQLSHLLEHMIIRSTDPDALEAEGLRLNGETTSSALRLETFGPPRTWPDALDRHARWLVAPRVEAEALAREQERIAAEERATVAAGATHKWAVAAWNQVARHGAVRAAVHGDVAGATPEQVVDYARRHVGAGPGVDVVAVGPLEPGEVLAALEERLGALGPPPGAPGADAAARGPAARPASAGADTRAAPVLDARDQSARWDLDARHLLVWYELPDRDVADRAAAQALALLATMRLQQPGAVPGGSGAFAEADLVTPGGRLLLLSAPLADDADPGAARAALRRLASDLASPPPGAPALGPFLQMLAMQSQSAPDLAAVRRAAEARGAPAALTDLVEAQVVLSVVMTEQRLGARGAAVGRAFAALRPERLEEIVAAFLAPDRARSLLLEPED